MDEEVIPLERCAPPELKVGLHQLTQMPPGTQSQVTPAHTNAPRNSKSGYTSSHKCPPELKVRLHQLGQNNRGGMLSVSLGCQRREVPKLPPQGVRSEPLDATISRQIDLSWDVLDAASDERMHRVPHNLWRQSPPPG